MHYLISFYLYKKTMYVSSSTVCFFSYDSLCLPFLENLPYIFYTRALFRQVIALWNFVLMGNIKHIKKDIYLRAKLLFENNIPMNFQRSIREQSSFVLTKGSQDEKKQQKKTTTNCIPWPPENFFAPVVKK